MNDMIRKGRRLVFLLARLFLKIGEKVKRHLLPPAAETPAAPVQASGPRSVCGQVVVITGSSKGVGYALAEAFLREGARVVINGRRPQALAEAKKKLQEISAEVEAVEADVGLEEDAARLVQETLKRFSRIDLLINNAAVPGPDKKKIWELDVKEWEDTLRSNVTAPFVCSRDVIRWAREHKHRVRIINVSSGIVGYGAEHLGAYNVSKTALEGLSIAVAADAAADGLVSVVNIAPRSVKTDMTKGYFPAMDYELMDSPSVLARVFLYAATAPTGEVMGRTISEPRFSGDQNAEIVLNGPVAAFPSLRIQPETFQHKTHERGEENGAYMHLLQNPFGVYPSVARVVQEHAADKQLYRYPDPRYGLLRKELAEYHRLGQECFTFGTGSSELIMRAIRLFGGDKGKVIVTRPTWGSVVWPTIIKAGLLPVEVPATGSVRAGDLRHDLDGVLRAIDNRTRLVYLVNPCNPTGTMVDKDDLNRFLSQVPRHVTVILDEAYLNYAEPEKRFDLAASLSRLPCRVIGMRTFSKFFALSGMRVGYAYATPETIDLLDRWDAAFNLTTISQFAAVAALKDTETQMKVYQNNHQERRIISARLDDFKIKNMPSQTSFILFDSPGDRAAMRSALQKEGIFLPNVDDVVGHNYALLPVGLPEHNQKILDYLLRY